MAYNTVNIAIDEILDTDFYPEVALKTNANFGLVKDQLEALLNNLEIDVINGKIGTDTPITSVKTKNLIVQDGTITFVKSNPNTTLFTLSVDNAGDSAMNVDKLSADKSVSTLDLTATGTTSLKSLSVTEDSTFAKNTDFTFAQANAYEEVSVPLTFVSGWAEGTVNLTSASRKNIILNLTVNGELLIYNPGTTSWNGSLNGIKLLIKVDSNAPIKKGQEFTFFVSKITSGSTEIFQSWTTFANSNTKYIQVWPDTTVGQSIAFGNNAPGSNPNIKFKNDPLDSFITLYATTLSDSSGNNGNPTNRFIITGDRNMNYI